MMGLKKMKCKTCHDDYETEFAYSKDFCDQYCAKAFEENVQSTVWRTVFDFALNRGSKPEEELAISLVTRKQKI